MSIDLSRAIGEQAEKKVVDALSALPSPWKTFDAVEWRTLYKDSEMVGEADVVVFHPQYGVVIFEVKAGEIEVINGVWYYASGLIMKQSPFNQARRNRYALVEKLKQRLGDAVDDLTITHAAWFPDVVWNIPLPGAEAPSRAFLFDRNSFANVESYLTKLFNEAKSQHTAWSKQQQQTLKELLAPDCRLLIPLVAQLDDTVDALQKATDQQMAVFRMLRTQPRLLIEGGAGSGKTILACMLAREHAALGKSVLLTCYNKQLALHLGACLKDVPNIRVLNFHELVKQTIESAGLPYIVPEGRNEAAQFFKEGAAEELLNATELSDIRFDTIIVDEAADFGSTWWLGLEALGNTGFSWYCFYDRKQSIYQKESEWHPPFTGHPMTLDINLRNPKSIGEFAFKAGGLNQNMDFAIESKASPEMMYSEDYTMMANQLRDLLKELIQKESIPPERITILAPHRHTNEESKWIIGLNQVKFSNHVGMIETGKVRLGTIQGFKGLESDVVIIVGITQRTFENRELLYVGASRARAKLYLLMLSEAKSLL